MGVALTNEKKMKKARPYGWASSFGSGGRDRTYDQLINSQLLYR
jgi:hypothetical protein